MRQDMVNADHRLIQAVTYRLRQRYAAQERADKITRTMAEKWQGIARSTKNVAANIAGATIQLLKWASITGLVSGLLGAGGLFGIDRLAFGVAAGRRSSLGLGTGIGEQRAFGANFGRLVDPDSFLSAVAEWTECTKNDEIAFYTAHLPIVLKRVILYGADFVTL